MLKKSHRPNLQELKKKEMLSEKPTEIATTLVPALIIISESNPLEDRGDEVLNPVTFVVKKNSNGYCE